MFNSNNFNPAFNADQLNLGHSTSAFGSQDQFEDDMDFGLPDPTNDVRGLSVAIRKVYLGDTRRQAQQHRRNYNAFIDGESFNNIQEAVSINPNTLSDTHLFSNYLAENSPIIRYTSYAEGKVDVTNGWDTPRFRFTLVVDVYRNGKYQKTEFISGYTDTNNVSNRALENSMHIDPMMEFRINQVTDAANRRMSNSGEIIPLISASSQVLLHSSYRGLGGPSRLTMRPGDIVGAVSRLELYEGMEEAENSGLGATSSFRDGSFTMGGRPTMSSADNALGATFTTRVVNALSTGTVNSSDAMSIDLPFSDEALDPMRDVKERLKESSFMTCNFVHLLNRHLANGVGNTATFTFGDLLQLDPTVDDRTSVFGLTFDKDSEGLYIPDGSGVTDIGQTTNCALAATAVSNTLIQLMSKAGVSLIAMRVDNLEGIDQAFIQGCNGMDYDGCLKQRLELLKQRLIMEAIPMIKPDPLSIYQVDILADVFNDVFIEIRIDGEYDQFLVPAYASSEFSPVITEDQGNVIGIARAINRVMEAKSTAPAIVDSTGNPFRNSGNGFGNSNGSSFMARFDNGSNQGSAY